MASKCLYAESIEPIIERVIAETPAVIDRIAGELPAGFPQNVVDTILGGLSNSAAKLQSMPATRG
jgi:serine/threonine-protein kinase HipA